MDGISWTATSHQELNKREDGTLTPLEEDVRAMGSLKIILKNFFGWHKNFSNLLFRECCLPGIKCSYIAIGKIAGRQNKQPKGIFS